MRSFRQVLAICLAVSAFAVSPYRHSVRRLLRVLIGFFSVGLVVQAANAKPAALNDYGSFIDSRHFSTYCLLRDRGLTGSPTADAYTRDEVSCAELQALFAETFQLAREFLTTEMHYGLSDRPTPKRLALRILKLDELNSRQHFSLTDDACGRNPSCSSGAYFGRTFYADESPTINAYVVFSRHRAIRKPYDFESSVRHELMHVLLRVQRLSYLLDDKEEHALIARFLHWADKRHALRASR